MNICQNIALDLHQAREFPFKAEEKLLKISYMGENPQYPDTQLCLCLRAVSPIRVVFRTSSLSELFQSIKTSPSR